MKHEQVIYGSVPSKSMKRVGDDALIESYSRTGNVWKTGQEVGMCGQSVYERLEVKGWKMSMSMKRINMFKERYPQIKLYIIDEKEYGKILSQSDYLRRRCVKIQSV